MPPPGQLAAQQLQHELVDHHNAGHRLEGRDDLRDHVQVPLLGRWGVFSLGRRKASAMVPWGGIECLCPLHARNTRTGCKKFIRILGPQDVDLAVAVRKAKFWAIQGVTVQRQWEHIFLIAVEPTPPEQQLEAQKISAVPDGWQVVDDAAFYGGDGDGGPHSTQRQQRSEH